MLRCVAALHSNAYGAYVMVGLLASWLTCGALYAAEPGEAKKAIELKSVEQIQKALNSTTELEFVETPLTDVIDYFNHRHKIEIQLDMKALTDANVALDTPITRRLAGITLRSALRLLLHDLELVYILEDEMLLITTKGIEKDTLSTKVYPVRDLLPKNEQADGGTAENYQSLLAAIRCANPGLWQGSSPPGQVESVPSAAAIVVTHTEKTHEITAKLLAALRKAQEQFKE
jgi:hypothetical protein